MIGGDIKGGDGFDTIWFLNGRFDHHSGTADFSDFEAVRTSPESSSINDLYGTPGDDILDLSTLKVAATLRINGSGGDDKIWGHAGEDTIYGFLGNDQLLGGGGDDTIRDEFGSNRINGGDGDDTLSATDSGGNNSIAGGAGNDIISSNGNRDSIDGGSGDDIVYVSGVLGGSVRGGVAIDVLLLGASFTRLTASMFTGFEQLGAFSVKGTAGNDVADLRALNLTPTKDFGDRLEIDGGLGNDSIIGHAGSDYLSGGGGDDRLNGFDGNDQLVSGSGTNALSGGDGDDFIQARGVRDAVDGGQGNDLVVIGGVIGGAVRGGVGEDSLAFDDAVFDATTGSARFSDFETIASEAWRVNMLRGTVAGDVLNLSTLAGTGTIHINANDGSDRIVGHAGTDVVNAGDGDDRINGGRGNDRLHGGAGRDLMIGGSGADRFVYLDGDFAGASTRLADRIVDFSVIEGDVIDLSAMDAIIGSATNEAFTWRADQRFTGMAGELTAKTLSDGNTYVVGDTNGDRRADFFIRLDGAMTLQESSFVL